MNYPKVSVVMSVYKPNLLWLYEQLGSIFRQDYKGEIELLIWNDSPLEFDIEKKIAQYQAIYSIRVFKNGKNNGVTYSFEKLTMMATGEYIAYCDQDDIWKASKISMMVQFLVNNSNCLCCHCNAELLHGNDIKSYLFKERVEFLNNSVLQKKMFYTNNWTLGCAMMMKTSIAKSAIPFPKMVFHDQWLMIWCAFHGDVYFLKEVLLTHRIHGDNSSKMLSCVNNKNDYYQKKLDKDSGFLKFIISKIPSARSFYSEEIEWIRRRNEYRRNINFKTLINMWQLRYIRRDIVAFEMVLPFIPSFLFRSVMRLIRMIKRG